MNVVIVADHHYYRGSNDIVYVPSIYGYEYWKRYLNVFDSITVLARGTSNNDFQVSNMLVANGDYVEFDFVYDFSGISELLLHYTHVKHKMKKVLEKCDCALVRVPSPISKIAIDILIKKKKKFCVEVAADPQENYDNTPFPKIVKCYMRRHCQKACLNANGVSYVTKNVLQNKYPSYARLYGASDMHFESNYSNIDLPPEIFNCKHCIREFHSPIRLIHVANVISGKSKGHYVCLDIVFLLKKRGIVSTITFVGHGPEVPLLQSKASELGIEEQVEFLGRISDMKLLLDMYSKCDILLLPSKTEGLPRCLIEAMACGLICLASDVGGIPELLTKNYLCTWNNSLEYADKIHALLKNPKIIWQISNNNYNTAKNYQHDVLQKKRNDFYSSLKRICED